MAIKFEASNKLETFIDVLKELNDHPKIKGMKEVITILERMKANPRLKAEIEKNDNKISGYVICLVTLYPGITKHPKNDILRKFIWQLKPVAPINNVPDFIWEKFLGVPLDHKPTPKTRFRTSG